MILEFFSFQKSGVFGPFCSPSGKTLAQKEAPI
jgi:hypothetical protein